MRFFALASLAVVTVAAVSGTTGVAPFDRSGAMIEENRSVDQRLLGIHYISLKDGVKPEDFERFVVEEWNPVARDLLPGIDWMILKGERNARDGEYLAVFDAQSVSVRDRYWPSPEENSEALTAILETCGEACTSVFNRYSIMIEETRYADYVRIARD
jgi:hypothetical protein